MGKIFRHLKWIAFKWIVFGSTIFLVGCDAALLDPKGAVGSHEKYLIVIATLLMLIVVLPAIVMTLFFAWKYRASNKHAHYKPDWAYSTPVEIVVWLVPSIIIAVLGTITWNTSHSLDPYKPIESDSKAPPVNIEVVALDWKWLFIYPDQHIASVNEIEFPANVPLHFTVTSDTVMNSFFIPALGTQIYAMAGMTSQVNLIAAEEETFAGISANFSGDGFSRMNFKAVAVSPAEFHNWVTKAKQAARPLDQASFAQLAKPSQDEPVAYYSSVTPDLFHSIVNKYSKTHSMQKKSDSRSSDVR